MASFADIRAKMNSKYGDSEEEKKKRKEQKQKEVSPSATANFQTVRSKLNSKYNPTYDHVDETYINTFLSDAQSYLNSAESSYSSMGYSNRESVYNAQKKKVDDLRAKSRDIRQYLSKNKDSMTDEDYGSFIAILDDFDKASASNDHSFYRKKESYSKWKTESAYNEYVRQQGLQSMSSDELKAAQEGHVKSQEDKDIIQELMLSNMPYRRDYAEQDGRDMGLYDEVEKKRKYISEKYGIQFTESSYENDQLLTSLMNNDVIAYTTEDGRNVTWDSLYDNALLAEDLASRFETYSKNADWEEKSKAISTVADTESDFQIVSELARTMVPYDWETAAANGVDQATFADVEKKRQYITEKYGVDLYSDIYNNVNIFNDLMAKLEGQEGEQETFEYMSYLTEQEKAVLSYIEQTEGRSAALAWHNSRKGIYQNRYNEYLATGLGRVGEDSPFWGSVGSVALSLGSGAEFLCDIFNYMATGEVQDNTLARASSAIRSGVMEKINWELGSWDVFDFLYSTGMSMADSYVGGKIGGFVGKAAGITGKALEKVAGGIGGSVLGLGAAAQATNDALDRGMSQSQAFWNGLIAGTFEGLFENWSIGKFQGLQEVAAANGKDIAWNIAKSMFVNASEEFFTEVANIAYDSIFNGDFSQYETLVRQYVVSGMTESEAKKKASGDLALQIVEAAGSGALMGGGFGVIGSAGPIARNTVSAAKSAKETYDIGKATLDADGGKDALKALTMGVSGADSNLSKRADKLAAERSTGDGKLGKAAAGIKNIGQNWKAGKVYRSVESTVTAKNKTDIATALKENGFSEKSAKNIADAVVASLNGETLTNFQKSTMELFSGNTKVKETITKVLTDVDSQAKQRNQNLSRFTLGINLGVGVAPGASLSDSTKSKDTKKAISDTSYEVSDSGKTVLDGTEVELDGFRKMDDGSVMVATADSQTADPGDVKYPSAGHALVYENYANIETTTSNPVIANMDVGDRSALAKTYDPASGVDAKVWFLGSNQAFWYGFEGISMNENTLPENSLVRSIPKDQRDFAYDLGRKASEKATKAQTAGIKAAVEKAVDKLGGKEAAESAATKNEGKVILKNGIRESTMTKKQRASYELAKVVAKAVGTNVHIYHGVKEYGKYDTNTGDIWLNINGNFNGSSMMAFTLGHELVHMAKQWSPGEFKAFADYLLDQYGKKGISVESLIQAQINNAKLNGYTLDEHEAYEEVIADAAMRMLLDSDAVQKMAAYKEANPGKWQQIIDAIKNFIDKIRKVFAGAEPDSAEAALYKEFDDAAKEHLEKLFVDMVMGAGEHMSTIRNAFGKGTVVEVNENGEFTLAKGKVDGAMKFLYNDYTWETGGRDTLKAALEAEGFSQEDIKAALTIMDGKHDLVKSLAEQFPEQDRINKATVTTDLKDGHSVLSALVSNGDYPVNIDLLMVCKKRKAYQRVINRLCETGLIQQATVDALAIAEINKILGKYGFETACLGCFVESRRLRIQEWAETIVKEWNAEVKKRNPNAKAFGFGKGEATLTPDEVMQLVGELESGGEKNDQGNLNLGQGSAVKRMGVLLDKVPSLRKTLSIEDLITPDGLTALRKLDSNLFSMVKSRYGSNSPKFVQEFNPYNHELAKYGKVPSEYKSLREYLYAIGGARMQSFSDFIVENWFDYCQIVADLAARKLPMHTYTKEIALAKLFGLTGIKINMSLIPDIDRSLGKEFAGLTRNANGELELIWSDKDRFKTTGGKSYMQSINFADAIALQNDPRYSANVGTIAVGVSDKHILMMLDDARIRMVIPYHSSGMNPIFADLMGTSFYKDYTMFQNTTVKQMYNSKGQKVTLKLDKTQTGKLTSGFQFNEVLQELGDARAAAQAYKDWCADASKHTITIKGETYTAELTPRFDSFSSHENYYKLLEDFNTYDSISEEAAPQGDVQQIYPEDFDKILTDELNAQEKHRQKQDKSQAFYKAMAEIESYLKNHTKADTVFYAEQHGVKLSAKDKKLGAEDKKKLADLRNGMKMSMPKQGSNGKKKNRASSGLPLTRHSVKQRSVGSTHIMMPSTAAAEILGISNIAELDDSVKNVIAKLGELFVSVDQHKPVLGFKRPVSASSIEGALVALGVLKREGTSGSAYRYDDGHALRISNHSANANNFVGDGEHLSVALFERGKMNDFVEGESNVIEAVFRRRYLDNNPEVLKCVIHDIAHFIVTGEYHDTAGALHYNFSGTDSFKEQANQRMEDDKIAREMKLKSPNSRGMSSRQLLADAFDELVQTPQEREIMDQYRNNISKVEEVQERLRKLRGEISKLTKSKGDRAKIASMNKTAAELADLIDKYDRKLLDLEASKPLKDVLARAKSAAYQEAKQRSEETMKEYRQQVSERFDRGVEGRRKTEVRKKIRKVIRDLDKILNRGDKKRNVKEEMKDFVAEALSAAEVLFTDNYSNEDIIRNGFGVELTKEEAKYLEEARAILDEMSGLPTGGYDVWQERQEAEEKLKSKLANRMSKLKDAFFRERQRLNKAEVAEVLGNLADSYAKLENSEYAYVHGAYHEAVYQYLKMLQEDVGGAKVKDMTLSQLEELYKAYTMVLTTVQNANKMFAEDLKQSKEELANRVMMEVYQAGGEHGLWSKGQLARNQASWNNTKPIYAAERTGSSTFVKLVKGLFKGQYGWATDMEEAKAFRQKVAEKYGFKNWDMEKTYKFTSSSGIEFELNLNQIMSLYAYAKREQAHDHLLKGGFVFGKNTEVVVTKNGIKRTYLNKSAKAHNISDEIMGEIVGKLSKEQKGFVDEMQDYLSTTMGDKGNEVSMRLYGVKLFMEKFYFPLRSAGQFKEKAKEAELKQQHGQVSIVNSGFTKAVTPKASNPVVLDGFTDVWAGHVNEMSLYHSMVLPMEDFRRVYNYASPNMEGQESASVNSIIENAYGDAATGYFDQLYNELNGGAIVDPRENISKQMIGKFKKASVMLSNSVWVQQFSAIGRAYALIDPKYFIGSKVDKKRHADLWNEMKLYAPVAIIKEMGGFDTHTGLSAKDYLMAEQYGKGEKIKGFIKDEQYRDEIIGLLPAKADELTWCAIWEAVKRETKAKNSNMDVKSEEFLKKAGERFSEVVEKTQVYDSVLARSANMRSKNGLMQMLTAFMAEPTTTVNMVEDALRKGDKKVIARTLGAVAASIILNNALASIVYAMRDDDEDETFLEKYAQAFVSGMLDDINPMTYYPILKDIWSLFQGYDIERSDMAIYSDIADSVKKVVTLISKYDSDMDAEDVSKYSKEVASALMGLLDAGASAFGIPWKNVRRDLASYYNTYKTLAVGGSATWNSFVDAVGGSALDTIPIVGLVAGESKQDKLYDAIVSGDTDYVNRIKGNYKDDKAYGNAVRKALRENDPRIHEAAVAWNANDLDEYMRIARQIIGEKHFTQDDVVMAIRAEANSLEPDDGTESQSKAKGLFTAEKFAEAIAQGDQAMANAAKTDIIQTAQKNGKTAEEAEKIFVSSGKSELRELFIDGSIPEDKVTTALKTYCQTEDDPLDDDDIYWLLRKWEYERETGSSEDYGKYNDFLASVETGKNLKAVIKEYTDNGVESNTLASQITSHFKPLYQKMSNAERAAIKGYLLNAYALLGYDRTKKSKDIDKWLED